MFMNVVKIVIITAGAIGLAAGFAIGVGATELEKRTATAGKNTSEVVTQPSSAIGSSPNAGVLTWDPFQEIRDTQMQMDKMFSQMSSEFRSEPPFSKMTENPAYSLSLNVENLKDRFVVRAFLPDTKVSDANVTLDNQTLKVDVSNQQNSTSGQKNLATSVAEWGQYEQVIQLPSPVKADQMQIERKDHELIITLPKE